ncbi:glycosyltransferase [Algoriphagus chordae]|uniref:Glycosyltransferase involved in cell wall biosynthesis n=1 Tax=Algoriphagus chordae TaxID=237019 RepID=A0A2W7QVI0_9BACT|nr:glycosyltransferase [Algoriphagus chordae]PZX47667.1 glycosyltransferase involved in cell wall biosynthesis [Algoriphagus chordae]
MKILFLGETYRADAQTWIQGIERESGLRIQTKEIAKTGGRLARIFAALSFLFELAFNSEKYDITLAERATSYGFLSLLVKTKVRIVAQQGITDAFPENGFAGWYKRKLQRAIYTRADLIHAWGYVMTYAMLGSGASPVKILVKPKGLDLEKYKFFPPSSERKFTAIVTRSLFPIYRHAEILEAIHILKKKGILLDCIMVGSGQEEENLAQKSRELGLEDQVVWTGRIPNSELPSYLAKAQIYIAVPETEGVSASLFEAMACGCFPIVTELPANKAFIDQGNNGLLVPVGQTDALATAIAEYLGNSEQYTDGIISNRIFIEQNCDLKTNMSSFYQTYLSLLKQRS